jgi:hypothetical protein
VTGKPKCIKLVLEGLQIPKCIVRASVGRYDQLNVSQICPLEDGVNARFQVLVAVVVRWDDNTVFH